MKPVSPIRIKLQSSIIKHFTVEQLSMIQGVGIIERHYFVIPEPDITLYARMQGQYFSAEGSGHPHTCGFNNQENNISCRIAIPWATCTESGTSSLKPVDCNIFKPG